MNEKVSQVIEVNSLDQLHKFNINNVSAGIGVFDGVHRGHRHLIAELSSESKKNNSTPVVITFFPHPKSVISPEQKPKLLLPHEKKVLMLLSVGAKAIVTIPFTREFSQLEPNDFLNAFLRPEYVRLSAVFVGSSWRFGHKGKGTIETLANFAEKNGILCKTIPELKIGGEKISSSNIRKAISSGNLKLAKTMLGRPYSIYGRVIKGLSFASTKLGFPTANLDTGNLVLPPEGVYSATAILPDGSKYLAALSIGTAPSVRHNNLGRELITEVHIIDFSGNLYCIELEIIVHDYIREQRYFSSLDKLSQQIAQDIETIKKQLNNGE